MMDEELVVLIKGGDIDSFGILMERYQKKMERYIRRLTNQNEAEIEDLVAETFVSVYENIQGFDQNKLFNSWIYRIAHNKCIDYFRKHKKLPKRADEYEDDSRIENLPSGDKLIEELEIESDHNQKIMKSVEELELKYREVVLLYYFEDKNYDEISDILHLSVSNVGVLLNRAKSKLRSKLVEFKTK